MIHRDHDGSFWPLVSGGEVVREICNQGVLVLDLAWVSMREEWSAEITRRTITLVRNSAMMGASLVTRSRADEPWPSL